MRLQVWYIVGMSLVTLTFKVNIHADPHTIFNYLSDWEKQSDWILFTTVEKVSAEPNQSGTKLSATTGFGPLKFIDTMVVTDWQPSRQIVVEHTGRVILGKGVFTIQEISKNNCEFIWEEITPVPLGFVGRIGLFVIKPFMNLLFGSSLKKLKRNIETLNS